MRILLTFILLLACLPSIAQKKLLLDYQQGKYGFLHPTTYEVVIPYLYSYTSSSIDGYSLCCQYHDEAQGNDVTVYYDAQGKELLRFAYPNNTKNYYPFLEDVATASECIQVNDSDMQDCLYGFINKQGKFITPIQYAEVQDFHEGVAIVTTKDTKQKQIIDKEGKKVVDLDANYTAVTNFSEGFAFATVGEFQQTKVKMIDKKGDVVMDFSAIPKFRQASPFQNGLAVVGVFIVSDEEFGSVFGVMDKTGKLIIPIEYQKIEIEPTGTILASLFSGEVV